MDSVKDTLFNYEYWKLTSPERYDITTYDLTMCQREYTTKSIVHTCLTTDLTTLLKIDLEDNVKKALGTMKAKLKNIRKDQNNQTFWNDVAPALAKKFFDEIKYKSEMEGQTRAAIVVTSKRILEDDQGSSSKPEPLIKKLKTKKQSTTVEPIEHDGVFVGSSTLSMGTLIKRNALDSHLRYRCGLTVSEREQARMTTGLSSILNLSDHCSQDVIFHKGDWSTLNDTFKEKYTTTEESLDPAVTLHWDVIIKNILETRDINKGLSYLYKIYSKHMKKDYFFCFKIIEHMLNLLLKYDGMLIKGNDSTENDFIRVVWSVILEELFAPQGNIKVVTGETANPISTLNRQEQYGLLDGNSKEEIKKTIGFKIDIRLVFNKSSPGYASIDLCAGEVAKDEDRKKTINDESKVVREAKDNLDVLLSILPSDLSKYCVGWSLLITGATCSISCLYLDANGLYVNVPKFDFSFPTTILELSKFPDILKHLLTLRRELYFIADVVQTAVSKSPSITELLGRSKEPRSFTSKLFWKRDTYYSPPKGMKSVQPKYLFGVPPAESILEKLKTIARENIDDSSTTYTPQCVEETDECDEAGWVKRQDGWFNVKTKAHSSTSPYDSDDDEI